MTANNVIGLDYYRDEMNVNGMNLRNIFHDDGITPRAIYVRTELFLNSFFKFSERLKLTIWQLYGYLKREIKDKEGLDDIYFVYDNEGLDYNPHPQTLEKCMDEIIMNIEEI